MADTNTYISKQKTEKWTTKEKFNALNLSDIPVGTEYNVVGDIEESDLDSALQTKINGKLTAPAKPTAESVIVLGTDGTVSTKVLSEFGGGGGGKLYRHRVTISNLGDYGIFSDIVNTNQTSITTLELLNQYIDYISPWNYSGASGFGIVVFRPSSPTMYIRGVIVDHSGNSLIVDNTVESGYVISDEVTEL